MLHVDPQRRVNINHVLAHPWILQRNNLSMSRLQYANDPLFIKGAVAATYKAINCVINPAPLEPVNCSRLAQRRGFRPKSSTDTAYNRSSRFCHGYQIKSLKKQHITSCHFLFLRNKNDTDLAFFCLYFYEHFHTYNDQKLKQGQLYEKYIRDTHNFNIFLK
uniref:Uncharacterized protein n=1 Tax=Romanomermis culicivorax TaxID=13658 RepID=A0A915KB70_ROMCU